MIAKINHGPHHCAAKMAFHYVPGKVMAVRLALMWLVIGDEWLLQ